MLTISITPNLEKDFVNLVKTKFHGDYNLAIKEFMEIEDDLYLTSEEEKLREEALKEFDTGHTTGLEDYAKKRGIDV